MKKVILIGNPVSHSLSPTLHNHWLKALDIDGRFEARQTQPEEILGLVGDLRSGKLAGINVTIPHKENVFSHLDTFEEAAARIRGANTLYIENGKLAGKNTDPEGFIKNLKFQAPQWVPVGKALILGNGAAARAAVFALLQAGQQEIMVTGRSGDKTRSIVEDFPEGNLIPLAWESKESVSNEISLVINATPLGLPGFGPVDFDLGGLDKKAIVYDLVYGREKTAFFKNAEAKGLETIDGLGMLVFQAIPAFETWFGKRPKFEEKLLSLLRTEI